jgi:hypothetical protein
LLLRKNLRQPVLVEPGVIAAHIGVTANADVAWLAVWRMTSRWRC